MNPYDPDPLWTGPEVHILEVREAPDVDRYVLARFALMGISAAIVIVAVLLVWRWLV